MTGWLPANPGFESAVRAAVVTMPAARHPGIAGGRLAPGEAEVIQPVSKELTQRDGFVQAGVCAVALLTFRNIRRSS